MQTESDRQLTSPITKPITKYAPDGSATGVAIETSALTKRYGAMLAVDHLDLRVDQGEIFGFLGPNGAGKTTTMRMLLGLVKPTSGQARVLGMNIETKLPEILSRTGSIIENPTFYPFASGRDNLRLVARLMALDEARIPPILDLVDLTSAAGKKFKAYSLGMKQRLAVGAALLGEPDLLILDEPANGLDPAGIVEMRQLMKRLKGEGHTVLISSHVLHEIEQICDRIAIMNRGRIVVQGPVEQLLGGRNVLEIEIVDAARAENILSDVPWVEDVSRDGERLLVTAPSERAADVTHVLADAGLYLSGMRWHEQSLEQYFLDVTSGQAA